MNNLIYLDINSKEIKKSDSELDLKKTAVYFNIMNKKFWEVKLNENVENRQLGNYLNISISIGLTILLTTLIRYFDSDEKFNILFYIFIPILSVLIGFVVQIFKKNKEQSYWINQEMTVIDLTNYEMKQIIDYRSQSYKKAVLACIVLVMFCFMALLIKTNMIFIILYIIICIIIGIILKNAIDFFRNKNKILKILK